VNLLLIISDPTVKGIQTAKRIDALVDELQLEIEKRVVIINRITEGAPELEALATDAGLTVAGIIPQDEAIAQTDLQGKPVCGLPDTSMAVKALFSIFDALNIP
jgi:CO dehydrogenase maturation factor